MFAFELRSDAYGSEALKHQTLKVVLRGTTDLGRFNDMRGATAEPFQPGGHQTIAVKVVDFRGNEVVRAVTLEGEQQ